MAEVYSFPDDAADEGSDELGREGFVARLALALESASRGTASNVIGLVGPWGSGKTTVLNMLASTLEVSTTPWQRVEFNPWFYSDETSMQIGFFNELRNRMGTIANAARDKRVRKTARKAARRGRDRFSTLLQTTAPFLSAASGLVSVDAGEAARTLGRIVGGEVTASKAFADAHRTLEQIGLPFVVVLDDLDRLDPAELLLVIKLVRLIGRLPNIHYVLSYDEQTLLDIIGASPMVGDRPGRANNYLEKIVQRRFDMPPLRKHQIDELVNEGMDSFTTLFQIEIATTDLSRFSDVYDKALRQRFTTPRGIYRFFAQTSMVHPDVFAELNVVDYLLMTWIRVEEPALYRWIAHQRDYVLNTNREQVFGLRDKDLAAKDRQNKLRLALEESGIDKSREMPVLEVLTHLFPMLRFDEAGSPRQAGSIDYLSGMRICHSDYFDRYFALEVPPEDIANVAVQAGVGALVSGDLSADIAIKLKSAFLADSGLIRRKLEMSGKNASAIARWMAEAMAADETRTRWVGGTYNDARYVLADALLHVDPASLPTLLEEINSSTLALEGLAQAVRPLLRADHAPSHIAAEQFTAVRTTVREVLQQFLERHFIASEGRDPIDGESSLWILLWTWEEVDTNGPRKWIQDRIENGDWNLFRSVGALADIGVSAEGTRTISGGISRAQIDRFFDLEWLLGRPEVQALDLDQYDKTPGPADHVLATADSLEALARSTLRMLRRN